MRILLLADSNSSHTYKWATALACEGNDIGIFSLGEQRRIDYSSFANVTVYLSNNQVYYHDSVFKKVAYLRVFPLLKKVINEFNPQVLHAHYASSYGLLGALSGFRPFVLSLWGSDVFDFPRQSIFHRKLFQFNMQKANKLLSTSQVMADEAKRYTNKSIEVTPFGIDPDKFYSKKVNSPFHKDDIVIGTVKTLEEKYGIAYLIRAFSILKKKHPDMPLKLLIVGGGSQRDLLQKSVRELSIEEDTLFTGKVSFDKVPEYHNMLDISVFVSHSESFGVSVIEASACEKPVVVSNVGGLPEVVEDGVTGIVVPEADAAATAIAIERLLLDKELAIRMGKAGRERVNELYNWKNNVNQMLRIYKDVLR